MDVPLFRPEQFICQSGDSRVDAELCQWLRARPAQQRSEFIKAVFAANGKYAMKLVRASQLPAEEVTNLLKYWLLSSSPNASQGLIAGLTPMLGGTKFWTTAAQLQISPAMSKHLNYHGAGKLDYYRNMLATKVPGNR